MDLDFKNVKEGDRVSIYTHSSRYPGTVLERNLSGKTIVVGENKFTTKGMGLGKGSMIKDLPIKNVNQKEYYDKTTFKWSSRNGYYYQVGRGGIRYAPSLGFKKEWEGLYIDYGR